MPSGQQMNQPEAGVMDRRAVDMTGETSSLPAQYDVQAVKLVDEKGAKLDQEVKSPKGETLGTIEKLIKDTKTGKIEYAVVELADTQYQLPLQWSLFEQQGDKLTLKATKDDLRAPLNSELVKDQSPEISQFMNELNRVRQNPTGGQTGLGIVDQPGSGGFTGGPEKEGGAGPSGPRTMPPGGQAPQFEGGNPSSKR
jgi:hypothetical protein